MMQNLWHIGVVHIPTNPGQFGISLPEGAQVVEVESGGSLVTLTYLAPVNANWADVDVAITWAGASISVDMRYVGKFRRSDGRDYYVFIRRD